MKKLQNGWCTVPEEESFIKCLHIQKFQFHLCVSYLLESVLMLTSVQCYHTQRLNYCLPYLCEVETYSLFFIAILMKSGTDPPREHVSP